MPKLSTEIHYIHISFIRINYTYPENQGGFTIWCFNKPSRAVPKFYLRGGSPQYFRSNSVELPKTKTHSQSNENVVPISNGIRTRKEKPETGALEPPKQSLNALWYFLGLDWLPPILHLEY